MSTPNQLALIADEALWPAVDDLRCLIWKLQDQIKKLDNPLEPSGVGEFLDRLLYVVCAYLIDPCNDLNRVATEPYDEDRGPEYIREMLLRSLP